MGQSTTSSVGKRETVYCQFAPKLVEDLPGEHWYVLACKVCSREYGDEWAERHHGIPLRHQRPEAPTLACAAHWNSSREKRSIPRTNNHRATQIHSTFPSRLLVASTEFAASYE